MKQFLSRPAPLIRKWLLSLLLCLLFLIAAIVSAFFVNRTFLMFSALLLLFYSIRCAELYALLKMSATMQKKEFAKMAAVRSAAAFGAAKRQCAGMRSQQSWRSIPRCALRPHLPRFVNLHNHQLLWKLYRIRLECDVEAHAAAACEAELAGLQDTVLTIFLFGV